MANLIPTEEQSNNSNIQTVNMNAAKYWQICEFKKKFNKTI